MQTLPPLRLSEQLAKYRPVAFPPTNDPSAPEWREALNILENNFQTTVEIGDGQIGLLEPDTELHDTVFEARAEAIDLLAELSSARSSNRDKAAGAIERIRSRYGNLVESVKHFLFLLEKSHEVAMLETAKLYANVQGRMTAS